MATDIHVWVQRRPTGAEWLADPVPLFRQSLEHGGAWVDDPELVVDWKWFRDRGIDPWPEDGEPLPRADRRSYQLFAFLSNVRGRSPLQLDLMAPCWPYGYEPIQSDGLHNKGWAPLSLLARADWDRWFERQPDFAVWIVGLAWEAQRRGWRLDDVRVLVAYDN